MVKAYETERLLLKIINRDAAPKVLSFYENNAALFELWEPKRSNNFYTLSYHRTLLTAEHNQIADGKLIRYWVFTKDRPEEIIGTVCFQNLLREPYHSCSIGYKFDQDHLHRGYATESIKKCIDIVFEAYQMHRIDAYIMPDNGASLRLIERLGFEYEGTSKAFAKIGGNWADHMHYARLNNSDL